MPLRSQNTFRTQTGLGGLHKTGNKIAFVDRALGDFDAVRNGLNSAAKIEALRVVAKAAAWWLANKGNRKTNEKSQNRKTVIGDVLDEAVAEIGAIDPAEAAYIRQKCSAIRAKWVCPVVNKPGILGRGPVTNVKYHGTPNNTINLKGGYAHERQEFLEKKRR